MASKRDYQKLYLLLHTKPTANECTYRLDDCHWMPDTDPVPLCSHAGWPSAAAALHLRPVVANKAVGGEYGACTCLCKTSAKLGKVQVDDQDDMSPLAVTKRTVPSSPLSAIATIVKSCCMSVCRSSGRTQTGDDTSVITSAPSLGSPSSREATPRCRECRRTHTNQHIRVGCWAASCWLNSCEQYTSLHADTPQSL